MVGPETTIELSDSEIVRKTLTERHFFEHIVQRYEDKLTRYLRRLGIAVHEDRQDILQDIFIKIYKNLNGYDDRLSFSSWVYRIAHNEAISWYRKKKVRPEGHLVPGADELFLYIPDSSLEREVLFDQLIDAQSVREALQTLETKYRDPIILRFFEYKEYDEISDILKIPIGTVCTLISRGKKKLAETLHAKQQSNTKEL